MNKHSIQLFNFHGDQLDVERRGDEVFVSVKRVCEALSIDHDSQRQKLADKAWAVTALNTATGPDGKSYKMTMIHLDSLPMWLATIDVNRVAEAARPKLVFYQRECARVLAEHFLGRRYKFKPIKASVASLTKAFKIGLLTVDEARATLGLGPALHLIEQPKQQKLFKAEGQAPKQANQFKPRTLEQLVLEWRAANPVIFSVKVDELMVSLGLTPSTEAVLEMPAVRQALERLLTKHGVQPILLADSGIEPFLATLPERIPRSELWELWLAWAKQREVFVGSKRRLFGEMRRRGWRDGRGHFAERYLVRGTQPKEMLA